VSVELNYMPKKLNLGCGQFPVPGYINVDLFPPADVVGDFTEMQFSAVTEVTMYHVLEHLPWRATKPTLRLVRSWMEPGATILVEVPDMRAILGMGFTRITRGAIYGEQSSDGEFHKTGFTERMLIADLLECGFEDVRTRTFQSTHPAREGFPCLEAVAVAAA